MRDVKKRKDVFLVIGHSFLTRDNPFTSRLSGTIFPFPMSKVRGAKREMRD
jgi:hypothetical protein